MVLVRKIEKTKNTISMLHKNSTICLLWKINKRRAKVYAIILYNLIMVIIQFAIWQHLIF